jgi:hypothetical protein
VRFLARARAAPSASGFDPAAPARSYRVGSGTTRSKPLAEGITRLTIFSHYSRARGSMARINSIGHSRHQQPFRRSALDTLFHLDDHQS